MAAAANCVELGQDRIGAQPVGGAEPGQVDRDRAPPSAGEQGQRVTPRVGAVGVAVEQQNRNAVALELEHAGL